MDLRLIILLTSICLISAELDSVKAEEVEVCPRKEHLIGGRQCKRACTKDSECKGRRKKCVCDDICGLTCLNPKGKCPTPLEMPNGRAKIQGRNKLGAIAKYSCNRGYELEGAETRICNGDREWSGTAPRCLPVSTSSDRELRDPVSDLPQNIESQNENVNAGASKMCPEPPSVNYADHNAPKKIWFKHKFQVAYKCRSPYISEGITTAVCLSNGTWAGPVFVCKEDKCPDLGELTNGVRYGDSLGVNSKVNYECDKGYRLIGSPTLTCQKGQVWDKSKPVCELTASNTCEKVKSPRHGTKIGRSYVFGDSVTIVCDPGYRLSGSAKRTCMENGEWSGISPECLPIDCGPPGDLWNGYIEGQRYTYGSIIRYRCLDGSKFDGLAVTATCLETGHWSFPVPRCHRSCARPDISNAQIFVGSRQAPIILDHGDRLNVVCDEGLAPSDSNQPICNNGTWSSLPMCVQGGCDHRPQEIANGLALYRGTKYGDRVKYRCNAGHKLFGDQYLTCSGGEWTGTIPECRAVFCDHPGDLENGKILLVGDIGKFAYRPYVRHAGHGEKIEYYCSTGYRLEGPSAATCIGGTWSPDSRPRCINNQHPMLPDTQELFTS
ncbi:protein lev-9-like isoform X2 [Watersipora subatra]|uniref:protein lev-9-like isoform X2 n=1 Tax=Watersipora subatra TaxID=2589382 RepID=UPI00355AD842